MVAKPHVQAVVGTTAVKQPKKAGFGIVVYSFSSDTRLKGS
jgi:hypothetical protein